MKRNLIFLSLFLFLFACKKENNKPATVTDYSGWIEVQKMVYNYTEEIDSQETAFATFYDPPINPATIDPDSFLEMGGIYAGSMYLNGKDMLADFELPDTTQVVYGAYSDEDGSLHLDSSLTFQVGGSPAIPAFTYNAPADFMKYHPDLPDTIVRSSGYILNLGAAGLGADSISISFSGSSTMPIYKTFTSGVATVTFTAAELNSLGAGWGMIGISLHKMQDYETGGKKYAFSGHYDIMWMLALQ